MLFALTTNLHVRDYNIVASKDLWTGSIVNSLHFSFLLIFFCSVKQKENNTFSYKDQALVIELRLA